MANVPEEIIEDNILTRLPVKSISRFRCVSKNWRSLFQNPNFIQKHHNHATLMNNFNILATNDDDSIPTAESYLYYIDNSSLSSPFLGHALPIEYPLMLFAESTELVILGSCNGLVCIEPYYDKICIWNPATREYRLVPEEADFVFIHHGFGFDCKNDDYKVVKIGSSRGEDADTEARLYSLSSNSWKNLGFIPYDFSYSQRKGLLHNGVLHWIAQGLESGVIVCFDISDETFHEMPLPKNNTNEVEDYLYLGIWEGKLCVLYNNHMENPVICTHENDHVDVLTMKDNKWIKHLKITAQITEICYRRPIQTLKNGEILLEAGPWEEEAFGLMSYDPNLERARALKIHNLPEIPDVETYIETLVALNSGTYVGQFWGEESTPNRVVEKLKQRNEELEAQFALLMFMELPKIDGLTGDEVSYC